MESDIGYAAEGVAEVDAAIENTVDRCIFPGEFYGYEVFVYHVDLTLWTKSGKGQPNGTVAATDVQASVVGLHGQLVDQQAGTFVHVPGVEQPPSRVELHRVSAQGFFKHYVLLQFFDSHGPFGCVVWKKESTN